MLNLITPLILTLDEAPNIDRSLQYLHWANRIVIIDSYSTDETLEIIKSYPQVEVFQRKFDTHANQWNYGLQQIDSPWVLALDADYLVMDETIAEIQKLDPESLVDGYFAQFKYCVFGKPLRGTILPPRLILFRKNIATYIDDGHTQMLQLNSRTETLSAYLYHDDRKPLSRWLRSQNRYMILEVEKLRATANNRLSFGDRIRKQKVLAPWIILFYCLILKGGILDGWKGWYYAFQRVLAELLLSIHLIESEFIENQEHVNE
jgi:glycosyltransferase involved in cell wall biosynthesis